MACSMPPMYWSTGIQRSTRSVSTIFAVSCRVEKAQVVPGRVDERVHRVGLAARRPAALRAARPGRTPRTSRADCPRRRGTRRPPGAGPAGPRPAPARRRRPGSGSPGSACPSSAGARSASRAGGSRPCPCPRPFSSSQWMATRIACGPFGRAVPARRNGRGTPPCRIGPVHRGRVDLRLPRPVDRADRQAVLPRELEVPLVVGRDAHDRAGAVLGQHEVGEPDRDLLAGRRVDREGARRQALLRRRPRPPARGATRAARGRRTARSPPRCGEPFASSATAGCSGASARKVAP